MPRIRCTQRLLKLLGKEAVRAAREDDSEESDLDWYANLFYVEGRKCLMFVNAGTLFPVVALDVLKDDFRDPGVLLRDRYRKLLRHLEAKEEEIERELSLFGDPSLGRTLDRSVRGFMADFIHGAKWFVDDEGLARTSSEEISRMLAKTPIGRLETTYPQEELRKRVPSLRPVHRRVAEPRQVRGPGNVLGDYLNRSAGRARSYHEILGYMYFLATSPEFTPPSVWMLSLLGGDEAFFEDKNEAAAVFGEMIKEYNRVAQDVEDGRGFDVDYVPIREKAMDNFADSAPLHQWSSGFALAYHARRGAWDEAWTEQADILNATLSMLMFFTSRNVAGLYLKHRGRTQAEMEKTAVEVCEEFSLAAELLATVGKQYREVPKPPKPTPSGDGAAGPPPKVGRNEPCPCRSGKKYKHCHGRSGVRGPGSGGGG